MKTGCSAARVLIALAAAVVTASAAGGDGVGATDVVPDSSNVCTCTELLLMGGQEVMDYAMGSYKIIPELLVGGRPVWVNSEEMFMYYSSEFKTWQVGESYESDESGLVSRRGGEEANCPHHVASWKVWTEEGVPQPEWLCAWCKDELASAFWKAKLALDSTNQTLQTMVGLAVGLEVGLSSPVMMEHLAGTPDADWIAQLYIAEHHFQSALELLGTRQIPPSAAAVAEWTVAFKRATKAWDNAEQHRPKGAETRLSELPAYDPAYPQSRMPMHKRADLLGDWGSALQWTGREADGRAVFAMGHAEGIWTDPHCRPTKLYKLVESGKSYFFPSAAFPVVQKLEAHIAEMQEELAAYQQKHNGDVGAPDKTGGFNDGLWTQLNLIQNGNTFHKECEFFPKTCALVTEIPELFLKVGQTKFSRLVPGTNIWPHCGPTNSRVRIHCALSVPMGKNGANDQAMFWVGTENRTWVEGECLVFQESCEHKVVVKDSAAKDRVVLIADIANPFLESFDDYFDAFESTPEDGYPIRVQQEMSKEGIAASYATSQKVAVAAMALHQKDEL